MMDLLFWAWIWGMIPGTLLSGWTQKQMAIGEGEWDGDVVALTLLTGILTCWLWPLALAYQGVRLALPTKRQKHRDAKRVKMHKRHAELLKEALDSHKTAMNERRKRHRMAMEQFDKQLNPPSPDDVVEEATKEEVKLRKLKAMRSKYLDWGIPDHDAIVRDIERDILKIEKDMEFKRIQLDRQIRNNKNYRRGAMANSVRRLGLVHLYTNCGADDVQFLSGDMSEVTCLLCLKKHEQAVELRRQQDWKNQLQKDGYLNE